MNYKVDVTVIIVEVLRLSIEVHARLYCLSMFPGEWISGAVCMYIASFLVENYGQNERVSSSTQLRS